MLRDAASLLQLVQDRRSFIELVNDLSRQRRIAVDTESNSLHAYRERVCLIQFSTADHDTVVDTLAIDDISELGAVFADADIEKIFHAAEYDLICLRRDFDFRFRNIFDTMQAGRILGRKLAGLDRLLEEKFQITIDKRLQKADWGRRPLTAELLAYAVQDTHYLIPLRALLETELRAKGLLELAQEDFRMACNAIPGGVKEHDVSPAWTRLSGRRDIKPQELTVLRELLAWRELIAERLDRPPFKVLSDEQLIALARHQPRTAAELESAGLGANPRHKWGAELLQVVGRGRQKPPIRRPRNKAPSQVYLKRLDGLKEWRKALAAKMDVESDVVLPRALLLELAAGDPEEAASIMKPSPWRWQHFGAEISAVLKTISTT